MFENVLGQEAALRLAADLRASALPNALLFSGPPASGKGTAALELARALSCAEGKAAWNCPCESCERHRLLSHPDLLLLGKRAFSSELAASGEAFLREPDSAARTLFIRAVRKLLARLSPVLWEGEEAKLSKVAPLAVQLGEDLEELGLQRPLPEGEKLRKLVAGMLSAALKVEGEAISDSTSIGQIRRTAYWARLAPSGRRKLVLIENADRMQEGARNALLKILEEPPETTVLVLSTSRRGAMMQTLLSRVRTYHFVRRGPEVEREVLRRVFRDPQAADRGDAGVAEYLASFLPVPPTDLEEAASCFLSAPDSRSAASAVLERTGKFESREQFPDFLEKLLTAISLRLREGPAEPRGAMVAAAVSAAVREADQAVGTYNQSPALALERLYTVVAPLFRRGR